MEADRNHPERWTQLRVRRQRAAGRSRRARHRSSARHLLRHAAHRAHRGREGDPHRPPRVRTRRDADHRADRDFLRVRPRRDRDDVDEPRRSHRGAAQGIPGHGREQRKSDQRFSTREASDIRRAVPPRGRAHSAGRRDHLEFSVQRMQGGADMDARCVHRRGDRPRPEDGGEVARDLWPVGRRRFFGGRGPGAPCDRESAHLHLRRHRAAAPARARAGGEDVRRTHGTRAHHRRRRGTISRCAFRSGRSGEKASRDWTRLHRRIRGGGGESRIERGLSGPGHALSRRDRVFLAARRAVGDDQDTPQRRRPQAGNEVQADRAASRAIQG